MAPAGRAASIVILTVAALLVATLYGAPSLFDPRLVALPLTLAASVIHFALALVPGRSAGVWHVDALLAGLLATVVATAFAATASDCARRALGFFVEWTLYLFGSGALLVAGGSAVVALTGRGGQPWMGAQQARPIFAPALLLALVTLGAGLLTGTWWAWQATGTPLTSDQRQVWMAVSWIVAGMALVAGELENRAERWTAGLAVIAALIVIFGLLVVPDLLRLSGG
jgi:hypothetical protein